MKRNSVKYILALGLILSPAMASALPWSWDMYIQTNHRAQRDSAPPMPQGTVAFKANPVSLKDRAAAARLSSPAAATKESIERGQARYNIYCSTCHGEGGKGDGIVGQKYVAPTDLTTEYVQKKPDGDIFYTITYGGLAIMPSYGDSVPVEDRWHIVNYIKHSLGKK